MWTGQTPTAWLIHRTTPKIDVTVAAISGDDCGEKMPHASGVDRPRTCVIRGSFFVWRARRGAADGRLVFATVGQALGIPPDYPAAPGLTDYAMRIRHSETSIGSPPSGSSIDTASASMSAAIPSIFSFDLSLSGLIIPVASS